MSVLGKLQVQILYDQLAEKYDKLLLGFRLLGISRQRRILIEQLNLKLGDTVIDLCCGTGGNLRYLVDAVGPDGTVIGVDLSPAMLECARRKIKEANWRNVSLIEADVENWPIPAGTKAIISTFGLEMVPGYDEIIERTAASLAAQGRLGLLGLKHPKRWPNWLLSFGVWLTKPFGVSREYFDFKPWEAAERHLNVHGFQEILFGAAYRCVAVTGNEQNKVK